MSPEPKDPVSEPQTVQRPRVDLGEAIPTFALTIVDGPGQGQRFALSGAEPGRVLLGQSDACTIRLTDPTVAMRRWS
jgi:hypothetical protein